MAHLILAVEDDENDRLFLRRAFAKSAPEVALRFADDGEEGEKYLRGLEPYADRSIHPLPNLVLLDLKLPRLGGLELLERVRSNESLPAIPVFVMSSSTEPQDVARARQLGAEGYFMKPLGVSGYEPLVRGVAAYLRLKAG